jgi:hypothetical protein
MLQSILSKETIKFYTNRIKTDILQKTEYIQQKQSSILTLKVSNLNRSYIETQITKAETTINESEIWIKEQTQYIIDIETGKFDQKILNDQKEVNDDISKKKDIKNKKKEDKKNEEQQNFSKLIKHNKDERKIPTEDQMDKSLLYFYKTCDSLNKPIIDELKKMPNNRGYIWRDVFFYGNLNSDSDIVTMYELKNGKKYIHTWWPDSRYEVMYKKNNKYYQLDPEEKKLISRK